MEIRSETPSDIGEINLSLRTHKRLSLLFFLEPTFGLLGPDAPISHHSSFSLSPLSAPSPKGPFPLSPRPLNQSLVKPPFSRLHEASTSPHPTLSLPPHLSSAVSTNEATGQRRRGKEGKNGMGIYFLFFSFAFGRARSSHPPRPLFHSNLRPLSPEE